MIPLVDLKAQYRSVKPDIDAAIAHVLENAQFALGPAVEAFEREFATYCTTTEAVAVNTGTSALHVALLAVGVRPGDEVITVPFTFVATVAAIEHAGATPVFVDIDPDYHTMDPSALERAITPRTRAVMPVHLFGQPADMDPIADIARRHKLAVIEDACQAHGADYKGRRTGSIGDIGCFSFYPGKNLGAYGEGGAAVTSYQPYADKMRLLRSWGEKTRYEHSIRGFNYRMDGIQGAVLGVKLRHLERWTEARRRLAATYGRRLAGTGGANTDGASWRTACLLRLRGAAAAAGRVVCPSSRDGDPDGRALSGSSAPSACVSRPRIHGRRFPGRGSGRARGSVAAVVR